MQRLVTVVAAANLIVFLILALSLQNSHRLFEERAAITSRNTSRLVAQSIAGDIDRIDLGLKAVQDEYARQTLSGKLPPHELNAFLLKQKQRLPLLDGIYIIDARGQLLYGAEAPPANTFLGDRDYFKALQTNPQAGLVISKLIQGRVSGRWLITFARKLVDTQQRFAGVVFATVAIDEFAEKFSRLEVGPKGVVVLRGDASREFDLISRVPKVAALVGQTKVSDQLKKLIAESPQGGSYEAYAGGDQIRRSFGYQAVGSYPLIVLVGLASDDVFAAWWSDAIKQILLTLGFTVMTFVGAYAVARAWRARAEADEQVRLLLTSAGAGIFGVDRNGTCVFCNPAAARMLGYAKEADLLGKNMDGFARPVSSPQVADSQGHMLASIHSNAGVHVDNEEFLRTDGTYFPVEYWSHPQRHGDEVVGAVVTFADITERRRMETELHLSKERLQFLAYHDALTGLPNRTLLQDRFSQALAFADRLHSKIALLYIDLDNFKTINDSLGHQVGDALLRQVADRLSHCVRETDTVSRQGGDEFIIVLPNLESPDDVAPILLKLMNSLAEPFRVDGDELTTSISVGISLYPDDGEDFDTLAKKSDMAMYRAKDAGRNTYRFFDEQMTVDAFEYLTIRNGLRRGLERKEFALHYQPQIDLVTGHVVGAEALVRWHHPELGLVPPGRFISVAEDSRLILPLGEWVLNEACRQAVAWKNAGLPPIVIAVNLSAIQFKRGDVEQVVIGALESSGHDPAWLELEITESVLIQNVDNVLTTIQRLKGLGLKVSIDDFGTGYSSLAYLKRFNVDKLKIDQSFVRDLMSDPNDAAIVSAIVQMGKSLNLRTIAEGVENAEVLDALKNLHCDEAQGYHFARPMPAAEFSDYLQRSISSR